MIDLSDFRALAKIGRIPTEYAYVAHLLILGFKLLPESLLSTWAQLMRMGSDGNDPRDEYSPFVEAAEEHGFLFRENHVRSMDHIPW